MLMVAALSGYVHFFLMLDVSSVSKGVMLPNVTGSVARAVVCLYEKEELYTARNALENVFATLVCLFFFKSSKSTGTNSCWTTRTHLPAQTA